MRYLLAIVLVASISSMSAFETGRDPATAATLSFFIPAAGQVYNESWWKAGLVLGVEGVLWGAYLHHYYQSYRYKEKAEDATTPEDFAHWDKKHNDNWTATNNEAWWLGTVIVLSAVDAYVDAHLYNYEEKKRDIHLIFGRKSVGISIQIDITEW